MTLLVTGLILPKLLHSNEERLTRKFEIIMVL